MPFYLNIRGEKLQDSARRGGFDGEDWRERVLADLLHDGQLEVAQADGDAFNLYGRLYRAIAVQDKFRDDTLFVIGLFSGPARGVRIPSGVARVSGPWHVAAAWADEVQTGLTASAHLLMFLGACVKQPTTRGFGTIAQAFGKVALPKTGAGGGSKDAVVLVDTDIHAARAAASALPVAPPAMPPATAPPSPAAASTPPVAVAPSPALAIPSLAYGDEPVLAVASEGPQRSPGEGSPDPKSRSAPNETLTPGSTVFHPDLIERLPTIVREYVGISDPEAAVRSRRQALAEEVRCLQERLDALPSGDQLAEILRRVDRVVQLTSQLRIELAPPVDPWAKAPDIDRTLLILEAMAGPRWSMLPQWLAPRGSERDALLADDAACAEVEEALGWLSSRFGDDVPDSLANLQPSTGERLVARLRGACQLHEARNHLGELLAPLSPHEILNGVLETKLQLVITRVDDLRARLHPEALERVWARMPVLGIDGWLEATDSGRFASLPDLVVRSIPDWSIVDALLLHEGSRLSAPTGPSKQHSRQTGDKSSAGLPEFAHPMTDGDGHVRSCLVAVVAPAPGQEVGTFTIAVRVKANTPIGGPALLYVRMPHLKAMPAQTVTDTVAVVDDPAAPGSRCMRVEVSTGTWDMVKNGAFYLDIAVPIVAYPVFLGQLRERYDLAVALELIAGELRLTGSLKFNRFHDGVPAISVPQEDQTDGETMKAAPLGVQPGYESLEPYVRKATKSFYVSAPRRFGKTTLLRYLEASAAENAESAVFRITLNRNDSPRRSIATVLRQLREDLRERLAIDAEFPLPEDGIPDRQTFRDARNQLAKKGYKNFVVLIDEAQSMVPRSDGGRWGNHLKDLIEGDLATQSAEYARVCLVMAGTPQLPRRLGPNCQAFMNVMAERTSFGESELASFLRRISSDLLDSTAQARDRLAKTANNLYTLKQLLVEVISLARSGHRAFFVSSDVDAATERLMERDQQGIIGLWDYVAAELSHTDEWDPIDAYPVALAIAATQDAEGEDGGGRSRALSWLDQKLAECEIHATVTDARVQDGIGELVRLAILAPDGTFKRPLLERLLRRRTEGTPFQYNLDQIALARLAADVIAWDPRAVPKGRGGQAEVFLLEAEPIPQAWRVCKLDSDIDRRRFVRTCAAIKVLRDVRTRLNGDRHLPRVRMAGFDIDDPARGIVVYDWIEGESFAEEWRTASQGARLYVAAQVAAALEALQARGVVHRDVHPRNILVDAALNAVLIDFGMACLSDSASHSHISEHTFMAPELLDGTPATFASDLYALGEILKGPPGNDYAPGSPCGAIVNQLTRRSPAVRPTASQAVSQMRRLLAEQPFLAPLDRARKDRDSVLEVALEREWLYNALVPHSDAVAFRLAGLQTWSVSVAIEAATCLNGVFEAWVRQGETEQARNFRDAEWPPPRRTPSLAAIRKVARVDGRMRTWAREDVAAVGALRIAGAHPSDRVANLERAWQHDRNRNRLDVYAAALKATAQLLDRAIGGESIVARFTTMLTDGR